MLKWRIFPNSKTSYPIEIVRNVPHKIHCVIFKKSNKHLHCANLKNSGWRWSLHTKKLHDVSTNKLSRLKVNNKNKTKHRPTLHTMVSHPEIIEHRLHALTADDTRVENEDVENQK